MCNPGYDFKGPSAFGAAHFMQVVWASSKKFGIGKATTTLDNMLCTWTVALYEPSGVMKGMERENVLFGLFDYRYCDTFGKGGGGKGASSGVVHNMADSKITAPNAAGQSAGKRGFNPGILLNSTAVEASLADMVGSVDVTKEFVKSQDRNGIREEAKGSSDFDRNEFSKGPASKEVGKVKRRKRKYFRTRHNRRTFEHFKKHKFHHRGKRHHRYHHHHHHYSHHNRRHHTKRQQKGHKR